MRRKEIDESGEAAMEGGNTEAVLKKHYLNLATYTDC